MANSVVLVLHRGNMVRSRLYCKNKCKFTHIWWQLNCQCKPFNSFKRYDYVLYDCIENNYNTNKYKCFKAISVKSSRVEQQDDCVKVS